MSQVYASRPAPGKSIKEYQNYTQDRREHTAKADRPFVLYLSAQRDGHDYSGNAREDGLEGDDVE